MKGLLYLVPLLLCGGCLVGYEPIYPPTPVGVIEVKKLPERTALVATGGGDAFDDRGRSFMKLFRYIQTNEVAMSVPVQASASTNEMVFLVGSKDRPRDLPANRDVAVQKIPAATVASIGLRGSYTRGHYEAGLVKLQAWLQAHPEWEVRGDPYLVYWNSPFRIWFLRRSEIHQLVRPAGQK